MHKPTPWTALYRPAAIAIGVTTALAMIALSHHPVGRHVATAQEGLAAMASLETQDETVHGLLILMFAIFAGSHAVFSHLLGATRPAVLLAMTAYGTGCILLIGAMLLDGFVTPQLAARFITAPEALARQVQVALAGIGTVIQVLSRAGLLAIGGAFVAFAVALATGTPCLRHARLLAVIGLLAGLLPAVFVLFGGVHLAPGNLMVIFAAQCAWHAGMAWALATGNAATMNDPRGLPMARTTYPGEP